MSHVNSCLNAYHMIASEKGIGTLAPFTNGSHLCLNPNPPNASAEEGNANRSNSAALTAVIPLFYSFCPF